VEVCLMCSRFLSRRSRRFVGVTKPTTTATFKDCGENARSRPLQFGTMIHKALERHFNGDDALEYFEDLRKDVAAMKLFAQEREEYGDILVDTKDIITDYLDYWPDGELRPFAKPAAALSILLRSSLCLAWYGPGKWTQSLGRRISCDGWLSTRPTLVSPVKMTAGETFSL
jgi:hypothetical protein